MSTFSKRLFSGVSKNLSYVCAHKSCVRVFRHPQDGTAIHPTSLFQELGRPRFLILEHRSIAFFS